MFLPGYEYYLRTAASLQWDEAALDLRRDAAAWKTLPPDRQGRLLTLLAGFCVGEESVAAQLDPFAAAAPDPVAAACFQAQAGDEARHARFFGRVAAEVALPGLRADERTARLRTSLEPAYLDLFERTLPALAADLAVGAERLEAAVALYHMILEGVVFSAGQLALLELLDLEAELPGFRRGVELVVRDERWHVGFGTRGLDALDPAPATIADLAAAAESAVAAWGDAVPQPFQCRVIDLHHRRLKAARLTPKEALR